MKRYAWHIEKPTNIHFLPTKGFIDKPLLYQEYREILMIANAIEIHSAALY
jgi:hypothetical protein